MSPSGDSPAFHRLAWADLDLLASGRPQSAAIRRLQRAERSRRLLLLRAVLDEVIKKAELFYPFPPPDEAWELLARVESYSPAAFDAILAHPYTGSWAGYTIRLIRNEITGPWPLPVYIGHFHALAAAAAVRARIPFQARIPVWHGTAALPSLGAIRVPVADTWAVADIVGFGSRVEARVDDAFVQLPEAIESPTPNWWPLHKITAGRLSVRLDDLDPFRGLYEPIPPERIDVTEVEAWQADLNRAWRLVTEHLPHLAEAMPGGFDSIVPRPVTLFRNASASTGEAFGSAIIARLPDAAELATTLVHEFNHIVLGGVLHLIRLCENDPRMRFYAPWRDDPRPLDRVLQGVYAFFGVTELWRALSRTSGRPDRRRAAVEFAFWRGQTWRALAAIRGDATLTEAGHRFVEGIAARLDPWRRDPVAPDVARTAAMLADDHYAGWRLRHVRPRPDLVAKVVQAWQTGSLRPPILDADPDTAPTPIPDGGWSHARADLIRLSLDPVPFAEARIAVPHATEADLAYAAGRHLDAAASYRAELERDPDRPTALVGLGLALAARGVNPAARALLSRPELVRAVHRTVRLSTDTPPAPEELASWIGRMSH